MTSTKLKFFLDILLTEDKDTLSQNTANKNTKELYDQINWADFYKFSGNVRTLFFSFCHENFLPDQVFNQLKQISTETELNNKYLLSEAFKLNEIFEKENIPAVFYKGIASLCTIYSTSIASRVLMDIDLIVPAEHYQSSKKILEQSGFKEDYSERSLGSNQEAKLWFDSNHFHAIFEREGLIVELHRNLSYYFDTNKLKELFQNSIKASYQSKVIQIPSPEFQIIIFVLNFIHDQMMNKGKRWYLEGKSKSIGFSFISLCFELKLICKYYKGKIDCGLLNQLIESSGEKKKVLFLLSQVSKIIDQPILSMQKNNINIFSNTRDPIKCLISSGVLFEDTEIPKTNQKEPNLESFLRFLFLFSEIEPRRSPLGKILFWLHCVGQIVLFPINKARFVLKTAKPYVRLRFH